MLKNLKRYQQIWIWILPLLCIGFLFNVNLQFNVTDLDVQFELSNFMITLSLFIFFSGLAYALFRKKKLNDYMSVMHLKLLFIGLALVVIPFIPLAWLFGSAEKINANSALVESGIDRGLVLIMLLGVFILFMATLTYFINIIVTLLFNRHFAENDGGTTINEATEEQLD